MNKLSLLLLLFFASCSNPNPNTPVSKQIKRDTARAFIDTTAGQEKEVLVKRGGYEDNSFTVSAYSLFSIPDSLSEDSSFYFTENRLVIYDKIKKSTSKIKLTDPCSFDDRLIITNVTKSLNFISPLFEITTPDCSDWHISEFIAVKNKTLQKLFDISDAQPAALERKENILTGFVKDRDELFGSFEDYPVTVSLKDFKVTITKPLRQSIGFETEALKSFQLGLSNSEQSYSIREGEKIVVDSLFRDTKQVRLIIRDSVPIVCPISKVEGKLRGNAAG